MIQLRDYQESAIQGLYEFFSENDGNPLVIVPTGGGKSLIMCEFCRRAIADWPDTRILIITHVRELIRQSYVELLKLWPDAPAGIHSAGLGKRDVGSQIIIGGIQSMFRKAYELQRIDLVLIDECHLIGRNAESMYGRFLGELRQINPYLKLIGLSATPYRMDSGALHKGKDALFSDIAYEISIRDLIDQGYLCPPVTVRHLAQINTASVGTRMGEFNAVQLEAVAMDPETITAIADQAIQHGADRKGWLIFACGVDHAIALRDAIRERGIDSEAVFGHTPLQERDRIIRDFKTQRLRSICSVGTLTTGFDARHLDMIVLARPTKSVSLYVQMVGRGTRIFPGKENCLVLDHGGCVERHGPIDQPRVKAPSEGGGPAPFKVCPECGAEVPTALRECNCGFVFPPPKSEVDTVASAAAILSSQIQPEWVDVSDVSYRRHEKPGKPASLCCTYRCGMAWHREWVCFEHGGLPRQRAVQWWQKRAPATAVPNTVAEALANVSALAKPRQVLVRQSGKFTEVCGVAL